jgi:hypothetical protein
MTRDLSGRARGNGRTPVAQRTRHGHTTVMRMCFPVARMSSIQVSGFI